MTKNRIIYIVLGILIAILLVRSCESEPEIRTETKTVYVPITDTIVKTVIDTVPKEVYVEKIKTLKGKDSIVYRDKPSDNTITANKFSTKIFSNDASADLEITSTGDVLDVQGVIHYTEKETTITNDVVKPKSGLFLYGETSVIPTFKRAELGLDYQFRNQIIIGSSVSYEVLSKNIYVNAKLGIRIF